MSIAFRAVLIANSKKESVDGESLVPDYSPVDIVQIVSREFPAVVFVNPRAGGGWNLSLLPRIREIFAAHSLAAEFVTTASPQELESHARKKIADGRKLLFAMGGDGTFQVLANAAFGSDTLLGLLPAGGGNDLAAALGLPKNPVAAAGAVFACQPRRIDLIRVRAASGESRMYVGGGGVGLDAEAARYASGKFRRLPGRLRYVCSALWALRSYSRPLVTIDFPDGAFPPMQERVLLAAILNTPTYGAGLRLAPEASVDDAMLEIVFVGDMNIFQILQLIPRLLATGEFRSPHVKRFRAARLRLSTDPPCAFHGDGEILGTTPVEIEVVRGAVQILAPPKQA